MVTDPRTAQLDQNSLSLIFERLLEKVVRRNEEDKYHAERQQRRAVDALRSRIKHLEPPVAMGDSWEQVRSRVEKSDEYRALDSDEARRSAFDKYIRRLKEKEEEYEKEKAHSRRGDKDRDRGHRNGHSTRHRTRTPEVDAYEADRRKAMADRERNYGKKGVASFSPPPYVRGDDRYDGRAKRQVSLSHYDRERRDRDGEREQRSYVSRADPRDRTSELDYGDSRPPTLRRRRDSDENSMRDSKVRFSIILFSHLAALSQLMRLS
jgi:pre-mRNA-processing factor 40